MSIERGNEKRYESTLSSGRTQASSHSREDQPDEDGLPRKRGMFLRLTSISTVCFLCALALFLALNFLLNMDGLDEQWKPFLEKGQFYLLVAMVMFVPAVIVWKFIEAYRQAFHLANTIKDLFLHIKKMRGK